MDWSVCDGKDYVGAVRIRGEVETRAAGLPEDAQFRIASLTKVFATVLTLLLVEDGKLSLDDEVAPWLPEAASPRVLTRADGPLDETVAAARPITIRHLLTMTCGWGVVLSQTPLQAEMIRLRVFPSAVGFDLTADEFAARSCSLPLAFQPGEGWLYDAGITLLGILLQRRFGPLSGLLDEWIFTPLGLNDTAFFGDRLPPLYKPSGGVLDPPDGKFSRPPAFEALNGGLVSSCADVFRFFCALADGRLVNSEPLLTPVAHDTSPIAAGWGLGVGLYPGGGYGWEGGTGTTARIYGDTVGVLLTQRVMAGPTDAPNDFWEAVSAAR